MIPGTLIMMDQVKKIVYPTTRGSPKKTHLTPWLYMQSWTVGEKIHTYKNDIATN